jgi:hypothetical protein
LPGDEVQVEDTPRDAGRIAAQTAKQVVFQRLREAERERLERLSVVDLSDLLGSHFGAGYTGTPKARKPGSERSACTAKEREAWSSRGRGSKGSGSEQMLPWQLLWKWRVSSTKAY